ncbi:MAG: hypothetical protein V9H26_19800 [Verrucomicrobiota bacterium]
MRSRNVIVASSACCTCKSFASCKLEQRADVVGLRRVNDDDALALLELADDVIAVERGEHGHGDGDEEPEPRQPVALREELGRVESAGGRRDGSRRCRWAFDGVEIGEFP